jgi:hypothetical protein
MAKKKKKGVDYTDGDLPLHLRFQAWMGRHAKHVFIASVSLALITVSWHSCTVARLSKTISEQSKVIQNLSDKVVFVSADGRVAELEKQPVGAEAVRYYLRNVAEKLIISAFDLKYGGVTQEKDMYKLPKVIYVAPLIEDKTAAEKQFFAYLKTIFESYNSGTLPEIYYIGAIPAQGEVIMYQDGKFSYSVTIPVTLLYVAKGRWNQAVGNVKVEMKGRIDLKKGTPKNPLGVGINYLRVSIPLKPRT